MRKTSLAKKIGTGLTIALILYLTAIIALAQEPDYDRINEIAADMNCPTCVGVSLADCQTQTCAQWRDQIGDLVDEGYSNQEVLDYFANQYGTQVLLSPPKSGSTLLLWVLPIIAIVVAGGWLVFFLHRKKQMVTSPAISSVSEVKEDDYLAQVDKDLGLENK